MVSATATCSGPQVNSKVSVGCIRRVSTDALLDRARRRRGAPSATSSMTRTSSSPAGPSTARSRSVWMDADRCACTIPTPARDPVPCSRDELAGRRARHPEPAPRSSAWVSPRGGTLFAARTRSRRSWPESPPAPRGVATLRARQGSPSAPIAAFEVPSEGAPSRPFASRHHRAAVVATCSLAVNVLNKLASG